MFRRKKKAEVVFAVLLSKQNYEIGEQISGNILFRKDQSVKFEGIRARFHGTETYQDGPKTKSRPVTDTDFAVVADRGKVPEGDTVYPIKFTIPAALPPSFDCSPAEIKYEIQAELLFKGGSNVTSTVDVFLHLPIPTDLPLTFTEKKDWGVIKKETLLIRCIPDKTLYLPNDKILLDLNFSNMTKKDLVRVIYGIQRVSKYGKKFNETCVCEKELPRDLLPVSANEKFSQEVVLELPDKLCASSKAHYVSISYVVAFKCEMESGSETTFKMPIAIRGTLFEEEPAATHKEPPKEPDEESSSELYSSGILPDIVPHGTPPPIPDRSLKEESEYELPSYLPEPSVTEDFSIPSYIETPDQSENMRGSNNIKLAKIEQGPELPMPYGHPCYYDAVAHYKPPTYIYTEPAPVEPPPAYNASTAALMNL